MEIDPESPGGGSGGGGGGFCEANPDLCDGGNKEAGVNVQSGGGGFPGPIQDLYAKAQGFGGITDCGDNCTAKILPDGSLQIDNGGTVTTWKEVPIGGGGGNDPNPNDSCTPTGRNCTFPPCPNTVGSCTYTPCGYVLQETQTCCSPASPPAQPKNPTPPDGSTDFPVTPGLSINVSSWGINANCESDARSLKWYGDTDKTKVANLDASTFRGTAWVSASSAITTFTAQVSGVEYDTTYYWRVVACNGANNCSASGGTGSTDDHTHDPVTGTQTSATPDGVYMFRTNPLAGWWQNQTATALQHSARFVLTRD